MNSGQTISSQLMDFLSPYEEIRDIFKFLNYESYGRSCIDAFSKMSVWYGLRMPRKALIDASGAFHHIICRGSERRKIF